MQETAHHINVYGRRKGRPLRIQKQTALNTLLPQVNLSLGLPVQKKVWLEIGFGFGEHLLGKMAQCPEDGFVGVEVFHPGLAHFLHHLPPSDYHRCRVSAEPIQMLFPQVPSERFEGILIFFPDPWPKRDHHKRRLMQEAFLSECHRTLISGGTIHIASDIPPLMDWMIEQLRGHKGFVPQGSSERFLWPSSWPKSRYQEKAMAEGRESWASIWEKQ
jgi:tRNA (guanine-N7-)-methyltransferase